MEDDELKVEKLILMAVCENGQLIEISLSEEAEELIFEILGMENELIIQDPQTIYSN